MIRHYSYQDPLPKQENTIPLDLVMIIEKSMDRLSKATCAANFIQVALLFCLRSCEYSKTNSHRCTTHFSLHNIHFHNYDSVISANALDITFLSVNIVTLSLDT